MPKRGRNDDVESAWAYENKIAIQEERGRNGTLAYNNIMAETRPITAQYHREQAEKKAAAEKQQASSSQQSVPNQQQERQIPVPNSQGQQIPISQRGHQIPVSNPVPNQQGHQISAPQISQREHQIPVPNSQNTYLQIPVPNSQNLYPQISQQGHQIPVPNQQQPSSSGLVSQALNAFQKTGNRVKQCLSRKNRQRVDASELQKCVKSNARTQGAKRGQQTKHGKPNDVSTRPVGSKIGWSSDDSQISGQESTAVNLQVSHGQIPQQNLLENYQPNCGPPSQQNLHGNSQSQQNFHGNSRSNCGQIPQSNYGPESKNPELDPEYDALLTDVLEVIKNDLKSLGQETPSSSMANSSNYRQPQSINSVVSSETSVGPASNFSQTSNSNEMPKSSEKLTCSTENVDGKLGQISFDLGHPSTSKSSQQNASKLTGQQSQEVVDDKGVANDKEAVDDEKVAGLTRAMTHSSLEDSDESSNSSCEGSDESSD